MNRPAAVAHERRAQERLPAHIELRYGTNGEYILAETCDLSPQGIGILGPRLFPIGTVLDLRFRSPREGTGTMMFLKGTVCHAAQQHLGVRFLGISAADQQDLRSAVRALASP